MSTDPLAGTPGASGPDSSYQPPASPYGYPPQYPPTYGYPPAGHSPADQEFAVHWPKSLTAKVGIIALGGMTAWLFFKKEIEQAIGLFGILMTMLGFGRQSRSAFTGIARSTAIARVNAAQAAAVGQQVARDVKITKEAVRDIQNDPGKPGTPGHMDDLESEGRPPFADL